MRGRISKNIETHLIDLERFIIYYNEQRFFTEHYGSRPIDVFPQYSPIFAMQIYNK